MICLDMALTAGERFPPRQLMRAGLCMLRQRVKDRKLRVIQRRKDWINDPVYPPSLRYSYVCESL